MAPEWKKLAAGALGAVNLGGALYLQGLLSGPAFAGVMLPGYYGLVQVRWYVCFACVSCLSGVLYSAIWVGVRKGTGVESVCLFFLSGACICVFVGCFFRGFFGQKANEIAADRHESR